jgi:hypothetical protein
MLRGASRDAGVPGGDERQVREIRAIHAQPGVALLSEEVAGPKRPRALGAGRVVSDDLEDDRVVTIAHGRACY